LKVFFDEGVPEPLERYLPNHKIETVGRLGWKGTRNGQLLAAVESAGFEAFITNDQRMEFEQNLLRRPFAILLLSTNHWPTMEPYAEKIASALQDCKPGSLTQIDCGQFLPRRFRNPSAP
jgi:hypothetical protein